MKFLLDTSAQAVQQQIERFPSVVLGQLQSPLSRYKLWPGTYAIDNGGFSGFNGAAFWRRIEHCRGHRKHCLFVACPDIVGSARHTLEVFGEYACKLEGWPVALVAQDGLEDLPIPWGELAAIFIGGSTKWKCSQAAMDVIPTALILGKHVHVGRVNTPQRFVRFLEAGAHTCDGTGVARAEAFGRTDQSLQRFADAASGRQCQPLFTQDSPAEPEAEGAARSTDGAA